MMAHGGAHAGPYGRVSSYDASGPGGFGNGGSPFGQYMAAPLS